MRVCGFLVLASTRPGSQGAGGGDRVLRVKQSSAARAPGEAGAEEPGQSTRLCLPAPSIQSGVEVGGQVGETQGAGHRWWAELEKSVVLSLGSW